MIVEIGIATAVCLLLIIAYRLYAGVIRKRNKVQEALSSIDVQLKKRADLIPNMLTIAKRFMEHEKELMTRIVELRNVVATDYDKGDGLAVAKHFEAAGDLLGSMSRFNAVAENYPELKSNQTMIEAQRTYAEVEAHISAARRFYNSASKDLKDACDIWPQSMFAAWLGIKPMPFFEADEADRRPVYAADRL
jgi:LemA protein